MLDHLTFNKIVTLPRTLLSNVVQTHLTNLLFHTCYCRMYGEYHEKQPHGWNLAGQERIKKDLKKQGFEEVDWAGEQRDYGDFDKIHPMNVSFTIFSG